jgi:nickel superoxide dismutase
MDTAFNRLLALNLQKKDVIMKKLFLTTAALLCLSSGHAMAHCEIPCGVYGDGARFDMILEHAHTIEKSMQAITKLTAEDSVDYHTIARWTANKEEHAQLIQDIAAQYFLTQRVKAPAADADKALHEEYSSHLSLLHKIMVKAMKTKQTTDLAHIDALKDLTEEYKALYFKEHGHAH